ncbi:VTC domain-containing protein [Lutimonas halocynthiae]|uniref:VTC domain-containing protein n=1 Tax=Lutimonas halocynthiae TaxID=1446477 RepID=UPI0025B4CF49|nr:VTC domain-containing protein [Lutimonas halocynthiae]MDN3643781.1 VTC domain-containing protein [Lutimonas halocynthiae]
MSLENLQNNYRYERKYKLNVSEYEILVHDLLSEGMKIHHPARIVNNIYFDTLNFDSYFENVEGESVRNKYRLRWYGDRFKKISPTFEVKMKKDQVNQKINLKIPEVMLNSYDDIEDVYNHLLNFMKDKKPTFYFEMFNKTPTLLNGYKRDYYLSKNGDTRLTIDRNLFFYNCRTNQEYDQSEIIVVEVKYASNVTPRINFDKFKLILGKNSKYVSGINYTKF